MRLLAATLLLALPALAGFKDGVYTDAARGLRFRVPKGWKLETLKESDQRGVCRFADPEKKTAGMLLHVKKGWRAGEHAKQRDAEWTAAGVRVTWEGEEKLKREPGEWLRVDLSIEEEKETWRTAHLFVAHAGQNYELIVRVAEGDWESAEKTVAGVLESFELGTFEETGDDPAAPDGGGEPAAGGDTKEVLLPNPWAGCAPGTWVKYRSVSEAGGTKTEVELTATLIASNEDSYTERRDMVMGGRTMKGQDTTVLLRQKVSSGGEAPKGEEGEETLTVAKGEFRCRWTKQAIPGGWSKTWTSEDVPARVVKMIAESEGVKSEMELVDFEKK
jgi:hypothetical protein